MKKSLLFFSLFVGGSALAQLPVSTTPENKNVVLEEYTGIHCTYCPDGHKRAQQLKDNNPGDVVLVNIHVGGYATPGAGEPDFRTPFGTALANQSDLTGYPAGSVNRRTFASAMDNGSAMGRGDWAAAASTILSESSCVNIAGEATLDVTTRELTVTVQYYYTDNSNTSTNKLNIGITQNNLEGPQTGAAQLYPANILPNGNYNHQHALRHFITGQYGENITTTTTGSTATVVKTYTVPADLNGVEYNLSNLDIVAYIAEGNENIITGVEVPVTLTNFPNQIEANFKEMTEVPASCLGNSVSNTPTVKITNDGEQDITSMEFETTVNGGTAVVSNWTGTLAYGQTEYIDLDPINFNIQSSNSIDIVVTSVNGGTDEISTNNNLSQNFNSAAVGGKFANLAVTTDNYPSETTVKIINENNQTIETYTYQGDGSGGGVDALTTFNYGVTFQTSGCYKVLIEDSYGDGMGLSNGNPGAVLENYDGSVTLVDIDGFTFSDEIEQYFEIDVTNETGLSINENDNNQIFKIYPNPFNDITNVYFTVEGNQNVTLDVFNALGQNVISKDLGTVSGDQNIELNGASLDAGIYIVNVKIGNEITTRRITLSK